MRWQFLQHGGIPHSPSSTSTNETQHDHKQTYTPNIMFSLAKSRIALTAFPGLAFADTFAEFCNDDDCSEGCGISVNTNNTCCLTQYGRRSVLFHGSNFGDVSMIASPGAISDCQNCCEEVIVLSALHIFGENDDHWRFTASISNCESTRIYLHVKEKQMQFSRSAGLALAGAGLRQGPH